MSTLMHKKALAQSITNGMQSPANGSFPVGPITPSDPKKNNAAKLYCKNCKTDVPNIVEETANGDLVCADCGLVLGDRVVDTRSEWRTFANDEGPDQSRVGDGPTHQQELEGVQDFSTSISFYDGQTGQSKNLQRTARMQLGSAFTNRRDAGFGKIEDFCSAMNVESQTIKDMAKQIYNRMEQAKQNEKKGKANKAKEDLAVVAACLRIALKENGATRTMKEICDTCGIQKKDLGASLKAVGEVIQGDFMAGLKRQVVVFQEQISPSASARNLLPRFCHSLGMQPHEESKVRDILDYAFDQSNMVDGRSPISVTAGAIWFIVVLFGLEPALRDVAKTTQVSDGTIKLVFRILCRNRDVLVPARWLELGADLKKIVVADLVKKEAK